MKKINTLALVLAATTIAAHAQSTVQNNTKTNNPLYAPKGTSGVNPLNAEVKPASPLYDAGSTSGVNPLAESQAKTSGQPIGGIVVKGGQNGAAQAISNPIPSIGVVFKHNITDQQKAVQPAVNTGKAIHENGIK